MGRRDICSKKNYDKMSFWEDYIREDEGDSTTDKKRWGGGGGGLQLLVIFLTEPSGIE